MLNYLIKRIIFALFVILGVSTMVFFLIHVVPGDPVQTMLGESAQPADVESMRIMLGLHLPLHQQWLDFMNNLLHLELGESYYSRREINQILAERVGPTAILALASLLIAITLAMPSGILAATHKGGHLDRLAMIFSMLGIAIPNFWMGPLLILVFSIGLGWFPVSGSEGPGSIVLPAITLGTAMAAILSRMIRSSLLEVLSEDYIMAARARGLSSMQIVFRHVLPNAAMPVITILGMQFGALLAGAVITETIFSWPGIGQLTIDSIQRRDYPVVQACVLLISISYVIVNLLTDICYGLLDPRLRLEQ